MEAVGFRYTQQETEIQVRGKQMGITWIFTVFFGV